MDVDKHRCCPWGTCCLVRLTPTFLMYEDEIITQKITHSCILQPRAHAELQTRAEKVNGVGGALGLCSLSLKLRVLACFPCFHPGIGNAEIKQGGLMQQVCNGHQLCDEVDEAEMKYSWSVTSRKWWREDKCLAYSNIKENNGSDNYDADGNGSSPLVSGQCVLGTVLSSRPAHITHPFCDVSALVIIYLRESRGCERLANVPRVTQPVRNLPEIQIQAHLLHSLSTQHLWCILRREA